MLIGLLLQAFAVSGFVFAESVVFFALLYILNGIGRSLYIPAQRAQIADLTKKEQQAEIFAVLQTMGAIGSVIGPLLGAFFYNSHPEYLFMLQGVALTLYAVLIWTQLPETAPLMKNAETTKNIYSPKQFISKHYAVFGLMVSTLPISFSTLKQNRIIEYMPKVYFQIFYTYSYLYRLVKLLWKSFSKYFL